MAQIVNFPASHETYAQRDIPSEFAAQLDAVRAMDFLESVEYAEIPSPRCVGDMGFGVELNVVDAAADEALSGWILVNYSLAYREDWASHWRCTGFFRQPLVSEDETSLVTQMYWDYAYDVLTPLTVGSVNGAATKAQSEFFDSISSRELSAPITSCEMRASWSPRRHDTNDVDAAAQINAWAELMLKAAGKHIAVRKADI